QSFFDLNSVEINPKKTEVLVINGARNDSVRLRFGSPPEELIPKGQKEASRILGVWVSAKGNAEITNKLVLQDTSTICSILGRKAVTDRQAIYVISHVLLPRILYKTAIHVLAPSVVQRVQGKYMALCKHKAQLPSTTPNSLMH